MAVKVVKLLEYQGTSEVLRQENLQGLSEGNSIETSENRWYGLWVENLRTYSVTPETRLGEYGYEIRAVGRGSAYSCIIERRFFATPNMLVNGKMVPIYWNAYSRGGWNDADRKAKRKEARVYSGFNKFLKQCEGRSGISRFFEKLNLRKLGSIAA